MDCQIESSAERLKLGAILILTAWADFRLLRGSGFLSANEYRKQNIAVEMRKIVRTEKEIMLQRYRLPLITVLLQKDLF